MAVGKEGAPRGRKKVAVEDPPVDAAVSSGPETVTEDELVEEEVPAPEHATEANTVSPAEPPVPVDLTPHEKRAGLRGAVERVAGKVYEDAPAPSTAPDERVRVQEAEKEYLDAYRDYVKHQTIQNRLFAGKNLAEEKQRLDALKQAYNDARKAYAEKISQDVYGAPSNQLDENQKEKYVQRKTRTFNRLKEEGKIAGDVTLESFLESEWTHWRYKRQREISNYLQFRQLIRPVAEKTLAARKEGLDARGKNVFEKAIGWTARQNQNLETKLGKNKARAVRALAGALVVTGTAASGGLGVALALGSVHFVRVLGATILGASAGKVLGTTYEKLIGKNAQEHAERAMRHRSSFAETMGISSLTNLDEIDRNREKLAIRADEKTLQKKKVLIEALTAFGVGAGTASILSLLDVAQNAADAVAGSEILPDTDSSANAGASVAERTEMPVAGEATAPAFEDSASTAASGAAGTEVAGVVATGPVGEPIVPTATLGQGEGFNHLFARLAASEVENPSAVATYLAETPASELSERVAALSDKGSAFVHPGDQLFLDQNQNLYFLRPGEEPRLLMENTGNPAEPIKFNSVGLELRPAAAIPGVPAPALNEPTTISVPPAEVVSSPLVAEDVTQVGATHPETTEASADDVSDGGTVLPSPESGSDSVADSSIGQSQTSVPQVETQTSETSNVVQETEVVSSVGSPEQPRAPWDFPGVQSERFINPHNLTIDPRIASAFTDARGNIFIYGGTYEQSQALAETYARTNPGILINYEGSPIITPQEAPVRWTATVSADAQGRVFNPEYPTNPAQLNRVPDPRVFTRSLQ